MKHYDRSFAVGRGRWSEARELLIDADERLVTPEAKMPEPFEVHNVLGGGLLDEIYRRPERLTDPEMTGARVVEEFVEELLA